MKVWLIEGQTGDMENPHWIVLTIKDNYPAAVAEERQFELKNKEYFKFRITEWEVGH